MAVERKTRQLQLQLEQARDRERKRLAKDEKKWNELDKKLRSKEAIKRALQERSLCPDGFSYFQVKKRVYPSSLNPVIDAGSKLITPMNSLI